MWPFICQFIEKLFRETIEPAVRGANTHLSTFSFTKVDMGQQVSFFISTLLVHMEGCCANCKGHVQLPEIIFENADPWEGLAGLRSTSEALPLRSPHLFCQGDLTCPLPFTVLFPPVQVHCGEEGSPSPTMSSTPHPSVRSTFIQCLAVYSVGKEVAYVDSH